MVTVAREDQAGKGSELSTAARTARELPLLLLAAGVIAFLIKTFVAQAFYIPSGSMLPQLQINDRVVVSKLSYKLHEPRRGDIVVFDSPNQNGLDGDDANIVTKVFRKIGTGIGIIQPSTEEFIKRVIALPGETVDIKDGKVFVNGRPLNEPYLPPGTLTMAGVKDYPFTVPAGHLWVMGDNRTGSSDSRAFGPIPEDDVVGRTILKVWPLADASFL